MHQQNTAAYLSPYTFSGKERDVETNLSYFGARYYDAGLSVWLSVDPMSDKYPSLSAYNYCALNPVMLVDPDGRQISWPGVTTTFVEFRGAAGLGVGFNYILRSGVVRDEVGKTHFNARSHGIVNHRSQEVMSGAVVSAVAGVSQDWGNETFLGQLGSYGGEFSASMGAGLGASLGLGESSASIGFGLGAGGEVVVSETQIIESISLTYSQADKVNSQSSNGDGSHWSVINVKTEKSGGYSANVTVDTGKEKRVTNQKVFSPDGKIWMSKEYLKQAQQLEQ